MWFGKKDREKSLALYNLVKKSLDKNDWIFIFWKIAKNYCPFSISFPDFNAPIKAAASYGTIILFSDLPSSLKALMPSICKMDESTSSDFNLE